MQCQLKVLGTNWSYYIATILDNNVVTPSRIDKITETRFGGKMFESI